MNVKFAQLALATGSWSMRIETAKTKQERREKGVVR
jgi:hypothetical protein